MVTHTSVSYTHLMKNDKVQKVKAAGPSTPVEIMGLTEVPRCV